MRIEFNRQEYINRFLHANELMEKNDIDALFITSEANYNYFSGFRHFAPWSTFTRPVLLFLSKDRDPVLLVQGFLQEEGVVGTERPTRAVFESFWPLHLLFFFCNLRF